jgi:predicted glycogen debranching enzyme
MQLEKETSALNDYYLANRCEWLETNGLGGYSSSSITGSNERRYHGILVAAGEDVTNRRMLLSKLDETIITTGGRFELATNNYGDTLHPQGFQHMKHFRKVLFPEWLFEAGEVKLRKTIAMIEAQNTVVIIYDVVEAGEPFSLELLPLLAVRDHHELTHKNDGVHQEARFSSDIYEARLYDHQSVVFIKCPGARYQPCPDWYYNFHYTREKERGLDHTEDLFTQGKLVVQLKAGDSLGIIVSDQDPSNSNAHALFDKETARRKLVTADSSADAFTKYLLLAADQFIVKRQNNFKTIIAGYHWFTDWGRDTMISLPGLCLVTGRHEDAKKILSLFARSVSEGMMPNRFPDNGQPPEYNTVDATLWFFVAVYKYLHATKDKQFVLNEMLPVMADIISWHQKGTRFNIREDVDGLLRAGTAGVQLTWMDAKFGDTVVTPRIGKAVEVNALWYNALQVYAALLQLNRKRKMATDIKNKAAVTQQSFISKFWNNKGGYLYDVIDGEYEDDRFRPNQLFAITLPFPLIYHKKGKQVLKAVKEKLYTPFGLRTLSLDDPGYTGIYDGDQERRDRGYHQGAAWSWLLGPYVDAIMKLQGVRAKPMARKVIHEFREHLNDGGIGTVSEIFDGNPPHHSKGCIAQAWGVAELLRVIKEYDLVVKRGKVKRETGKVNAK